MPSQYIELQFWQVSLAAALILISGTASLALQLRLERQLLVAAVRTVVQLLLVGLVLKWVFAPGRQLVFVLLLMSLMTVIAGISAVGRCKNTYRGVWLDSVVSMWAASWLIGAVAVLLILRVPDASFAQYAVPLLGMILGNTLNGISLGLDRLMEEFGDKREEVETLLALGATRWEAAHGRLQSAVRTGMIPIINSMMVVGLVSLPGMMTGQLLAGVDPVQAVMYQIVIMFVIAAGTSLGTVAVVMLAYRKMFNHDHQFLPERLVRR